MLGELSTEPVHVSEYQDPSFAMKTPIMVQSRLYCTVLSGKAYMIFESFHSPPLRVFRQEAFVIDLPAPVITKPQEPGKSIEN